MTTRECVHFSYR